MSLAFAFSIHNKHTGVRGGGRDVGVTGSLIGACAELELVGSLEVCVAGGAVGGDVILEVKEKDEHWDFNSEFPPKMKSEICEILTG